MRQLLVLLIVTSLLVAPLAFASQVQADTRRIPTPLLAWSGRSLFSGKSVYSSLSSDSLFATIDALVGKQSQSPLLKQAEHVTELILICGVQVSTEAFELAAIHKQLPSLKRLIETSSSSVVAPYFYGNAASMRSFAYDLQRYDVQEIIDASSLKTLLARDNALLTNGRADVLLVNLDVASAGPAAVDMQLAELNKIVAENTQDYVMIVVAPEMHLADVYVQPIAEPELPPLRARRSEPIRFFAEPSRNTTHYHTYFLPAINEAIIVCVLLLIILTVALCATCTLQSPERFEGAQLKRPIARRS